MNTNFMIAAPEIFLVVMGCAILLIGVFQPKRAAPLSYWLTQISLLITIVLVFFIHSSLPAFTFHNLFMMDRFAFLLKPMILITTIVVLLYSREELARLIPKYQLEYYLLSLFAVLGMLVLVSANNFIILFLGLELFALPVYAMVALQRDAEICTEAALKYFVVGSIASAMLLYGLSLLYGATHSLQIPIVAQVLSTLSGNQQLLAVCGVVFVVVGIAFKLGAVPFHMWVPDVYEGAPNAVTLFIASAPKIAALALAVRLVVDTLPMLAQQWQPLFIVIAVLSMAIGNIVAIVQSNLKRMLAYSSIAHMGYMLLGLLTATPEGYAAATFYMLAYALMTLVAFGMLLVLSKSGFEAATIEDFQGLNNRNPGLAFIMLIVMFSLAGIPPLVGFMAKVAVLEALIQVRLVWLATLALLFAIVGAYYYLRVVKVMYFEAAQDDTPVHCGNDVKVVMTVNAVLVLILGLFPGILLMACRAVF